MAWQSIEGHDAIAERFATAAALGRVAGSYLFIGPSGVGKSTFARGLAKALLCQQPQPDLVACNACASCVQAEAGSHPDIDVVQKPEDRATIPLEAFVGDAEHRMREGLCWRVKLRPAVGTRKAAIILDADLMLAEAANCLLKTLEEPPDGAVIILVGESLERQLPTIRSRCQIVRFKPLAPEIIGQVLEREAAAAGGPVDSAVIARVSHAAGGSLTRARLLLDPAAVEFRTQLIGLLAGRPLRGVELARETLSFVEAAGKEAPPRRARLKVVLEGAIDFYRAALRQATTGEPPADAALARAVAGWAVETALEGEAAEAAAILLEHSLDALDSVDRNANLAILIDAWTAILEAPRLAATGKP
ncbi:MAG: DNA polymerase III subunit delta' [Planctomycetota bacterium]|nr:DNA polymerase III subunit delta' [Planctomycetota bacterium]